LALLEVRDLTVFYDAVLALDKISFNIERGEIVAMIGPNGAGKSTALKAVCGLVNIKSGEVFYRDENITGFKPYKLVLNGLSLVPEGRHVFPTMTVLENLEMGTYISNKKEFITSNLREIFDLFPVLKERSRQKAGTLSTGEQQMLAIGRALMLKPELLLIDEPSVGLSPNFVEIVFTKLKEINGKGTTILLVEQNARMALEYATRAYVFDIGKIILEGSTSELKSDDRIQRTYLGG
jgi:branched-chain amino acid transport system ATP-binding protein